MICCLNPNCDRPMNKEYHSNCQNCGTRLKSSLRNHYQIVEPLGRGGFSKTYLAKDTDKLNEICVVKQLAFNSTQTKAIVKAKELFFLEAQQLQRLGEHPQIPHLLAYFEEEGYLYLVQQYIEGRNLAERLKLAGVYNEFEIRKFLLDILPVFQYIHERGAIHRDIKPSNIIYSVREDKYFPIDFGISKVISASDKKTRGTAIGSQGYAAPEQCEGQAVPASDLYSLGVSCFSLLSGISPYDLWRDCHYGWVENWQELIKISLSSQLASVLDRLLQKDVNKRYQKAEEVLLDLQNWQELIKMTLNPQLASVLERLLDKDINKIEPTVEAITEEIELPIIGSEKDRSLIVELDSQEHMFSQLDDAKQETDSVEGNNIDLNSQKSELKQQKELPAFAFANAKEKSQNRPQKINKLQIALFITFGVSLLFVLQYSFNRNSSLRRQGPISQPEVDKPHDRGNEIKFGQIEEVPIVGLFSYGGSTTWASIRAKIEPEIEQNWPDYQLLYLDPIVGNPGSRVAINMLIDDRLSFALSSRPLQDEEYQKARSHGFNLEQIPVAIDAIAVAVNPSLPVSGLTLAQLSDIYTGRITNWQEVGGPNLPIVPYTRNLKEAGTVEFFVKNVLEDREFGENVVITNSTTETIRKVAANPGGIYYASASQIVSQCKVKAIAIGHRKDRLVSPYLQPVLPASKCNASNHNKLNKQAVIKGEYPIIHRLFVILRKDGQEDEKAARAYVKILTSDRGQKIIEEAGFIGIYEGHERNSRDSSK